MAGCHGNLRPSSGISPRAILPCMLGAWRWLGLGDDRKCMAVRQSAWWRWSKVFHRSDREGMGSSRARWVPFRIQEAGRGYQVGYYCHHRWQWAIGSSAAKERRDEASRPRLVKGRRIFVLVVNRMAESQYKVQFTRVTKNSETCILKRKHDWALNILV